jgi:hypothetical protein
MVLFYAGFLENKMDWLEAEYLTDMIVKIVHAIKDCHKNLEILKFYQPKGNKDD